VSIGVVVLFHAPPSGSAHSLDQIGAVKTGIRWNERVGPGPRRNKADRSRPCLHQFRREPASEAITGLSQAYDSRIDFPKVSYACDGNTEKQQPAMSFCSSSPCTVPSEQDLAQVQFLRQRLPAGDVPDRPPR